MPDALPSIAVVDDERFDAHHDRGYHPECPERLDAARAALKRSLPAERRVELGARPATDAELEAVHRADYVAALRGALAKGFGHLDPDTFFSPGSREAAWLAAGGAAELGAALARQDVARGIALLRPPGHHAEPARPMGFCMLNNIAVAAQSALAAGAQRVAIVDWDVHHGNGTQAAFYSDPRVLFVSLHQYPHYPGTGPASEVGAGEGRGLTANLALPAGSGAETYSDAFRRVVLPLLEGFGAEVLLVSAGFDAHARDPLASMELETPAYHAMASALLDHAEAHGARVGHVLEGGYDLRALEDSVAAVVRATLGERSALAEDPVPPRARAAIDETLLHLQRAGALRDAS